MYAIHGCCIGTDTIVLIKATVCSRNCCVLEIDRNQYNKLMSEFLVKTPTKISIFAIPKKKNN